MTGSASSGDGAPLISHRSLTASLTLGLLRCMRLLTMKVQ
jgi:hypothetical protein